MSDIQITISTTDANSAVVIQRVSESMQKLGKQTKDTSDKAKDADKDWKQFATGLNQGLEIINKVTSGLKSVYDIAKTGADFSENKNAWRDYAASVGIYADEMIEASKRAVSGQVTDAELIAKTYSAVKLGVSRNTSEIAELWRIAEAKSDELGGTITDNFKLITDAIVSGNAKSLISMGLLPESFTKAKDSAELLSRRGEVLNSVLEQFGSKGSDASDGAMSAADSFAAFDASVTNLKESITELAPALQPAITKLQELTEGLAEFLRERGLLESGRNPYVNVSSNDVLEKALQREQQKATQAGRAAIVFEDNRTASVAEGRYGDANTALAQYRKVATVRDNAEEAVKQLTEALKLNKELEDGARNADLWQEYDERISNLAKAHSKAGSGAKAHTEKVKDLFAAYEQIGKKAAEAANDPKWASGMAAMAGTGAIGFDVKAVVAEAEKLNAELQDILDKSLDISAEWADIAGEFEGAFDDADKMLDEGTEQIANDFADNIREPVAISISDAIAQGLNEAGNAGTFENFAQTVGNALRRQVVAALTQQITGGMGNIMGWMGSSGIIYGNNQSIGPNDVAVGSGGSNGNSLLGGLLSKGNLLTNIGTGLAVGYGINKLFGSGGLFGSSVIHGGEVIQQASDINTQVRQAADQRSVVAGQSGISDETFEKLQSLIFYTAGYTKDKSGNGITSKKTTTYALDASAAQSALAEYGKLVATASAEAAAREYEKSFAAITSPTKALGMTIEDLNKVVKRATDANGTVSETGKQALLQIEQIKAQLASTAIARAGDWFNYALTNPLSLDSTAKTGFLDDGETLGEYAISRYQYPRVPDPTTALTIGGNSLYGSDITTYLDQRAMAEGLKKQYSKEYDLYALSLDPNQQDAYLKARAEQLNEQIETAKKLADIAEAKFKDLNSSMEAKAQAFQEFQQAEAEYYKKRQQELDVEIQQKQAIKAKQEKLRDEKLSSLLSFAGELGGRNGDTYNILSATESVTLLQQLKDANAGKNPELTMLLDAMIARAVKKAKWG